VFGDALGMLMANHGPMVVGQTVAQAFQMLYYLDRIADIQMRALSAGQDPGD
jgi:ribulose-5-phosphate 4-epimerase/fuculose-1-phosphate aldolase